MMKNNLASRFTLHASRFRLQASRFIFGRAACSLRRIAYCLFSLAFILSPLMCFAQSISSSELINNARLYDGKIVTYEGEVVGDVMARGEYAWVNLNDGINAIGAWMERALTKDILYSASYKFKGDRIEITGKFSRACPAHGGDLDIHAQAIRKVMPGRPVQEHLNPGKRNHALILLGVLCLILILNALKTK